MSIKQRIYIFLTAFWAIVMIALLVWMIVEGDYRLWAVEPVLLCVFAISLRGYALEWRRLRDERERQAKR